MTDGQIRFSGRLDVALTGSVNNWAPAGIGSSGSIYITADGDYNITGILAESDTGLGTAPERALFLQNTDASNTVSLVGSSGSSDPENQFGWAGTVVLAAGDGLLIKYDRIAELWRSCGRLSSGGTPGGSDTHVQFNDAGALGGEAGFSYDKTNDQFSATCVKVGSILGVAGDVSVTVSTTPQNDWNPGGSIATAGLRLRVNPDTADVSITGIVAPSATFDDGRLLTIENVGTGGFILNIIDASASSTAANRFAVGGSFAIPQNQGALFVYDNVSDRWNCIGRMWPAIHTHTSATTGGQLGTGALQDAAVTYAKIQDVSATDKLLGRSTAGAGDVEEIACTAAGRAILDDATAADQRTTLGLGTVAVESTVPIAKGGTGQTSQTAGFAALSPTTTKGDLIVDNGTDPVRLAVGATTGHVLTVDPVEATGVKWAAAAGGGDALVASPLSQFAATTSAQLKGVISDETGTAGALVFADTPTLIAPLLGTPTSGVLTNCTGLPTAGLVNDAVTYAKMQNISATDKVLGRSTAGAGDVEEIACTAAGRALIDDADASAQRTTLGLGTAAVAAGPSGTIVGTTDTQTLSAKTLTTPTIGSFTNAGHTHADAANAGTLNASAIAAGTMATARLGSGTANDKSFLRGDQTYAPVSTFVELGSDVVNNNATPNTIADVTGLSFAVSSGVKYWFRFVISYTSAASSTGSRWSVNGPTFTSLLYATQFNASVSTAQFQTQVAYDLPIVTSAGSATTDPNTAILEGIITPSASGTLIARFASEIASSAITAKTGSWCEWRVIG